MSNKGLLVVVFVVFALFMISGCSLTPPAVSVDNSPPSAENSGNSGSLKLTSESVDSEAPPQLPDESDSAPHGVFG